MIDQGVIGFQMELEGVVRGREAADKPKEPEIQKASPPAARTGYNNNLGFRLRALRSNSIIYLTSTFSVHNPLA
jgi:hypothetical protein